MINIKNKIFVTLPMLILRFFSLLLYKLFSLPCLISISAIVFENLIEHLATICLSIYQHIKFDDTCCLKSLNYSLFLLYILLPYTFTFWPLLWYWDDIHLYHIWLLNFRFLFLLFILFLFINSNHQIFQIFYLVLYFLWLFLVILPFIFYFTRIL